MTTHISMDTETPATGLGLTPLPTSSPVRHLCGGPESDGRRLVREQFSGANQPGATADVFAVLDEVLDGGLLELGARLEIVRANSWWSRHGLGFGVNELVGRRLGEVVEDADGGWSDRFGQWAVQPDGAFVHELRLVLPANASNSTVWIELTLRRAKSGGDRGTAYLALARDVTEGRREREEARAALERERELNSLKSNFVTMVSHEFRNPLTAIVCATEVLQLHAETEEATDSATTREYLGAILKASDRMCRLMDELLLLGRIESGALRFNPIEISPMDLCESLRRDVGAPDRQARIEIRSALAAGETASLDPTLLRHTLLNLMTNALKYSPTDKPVTVSVRADGDQVCFEVEDRGIGIPEKDQERMFRAFFRASNVGSVQGTGVGLSIARQCARLHGGQLAFRSAAGQGTTFTLRLPRRATVEVRAGKAIL
jgi:signal transduction histidine kinase